jgi:uncharacterized protein (DUF488 family)
MLAAELEAAGVERVLDVRERAQSRKPGMSKTNLTNLFGAQGIAYEHRRALGTPPELRVLYRSNKVQRAAAGYREHVEGTAREEIDQLAAELDGGPRTALLCLEEDPDACHRRVITEALRDRRPDLTVVDL